MDNISDVIMDDYCIVIMWITALVATEAGILFRYTCLILYVCIQIMAGVGLRMKAHNWR